ncbi:MAG: hypothetical protein KAI67_04980 [Candidatus Pacebacteria bacterium]|nr:hypothetical protein [Candidatus Paceibacterota bacterium]
MILEFLSSALFQNIALVVTLYFLIKYTKATEEMKNEIVKQVELEQMPVMIMYIRNKRDYMSDPADYNEQEKLSEKFEDYLIRIRIEPEKSDFFLSLRNTGRGAAFNLNVKNKNFQVSKYESQFFAPSNDEHSIAIIKNGNKKIESWDELNGSIFKISCENAVKKLYHFHYKIIDIKNKQVEYLGN